MGAQRTLSAAVSIRQPAEDDGQGAGHCLPHDRDTPYPQKAGHKNSTDHTGAVTLIQRFVNALNLNIQFHMLFLDGVYAGKAKSSARFRWVKAPSSAELTHLTHTIAQPLGAIFGAPGFTGAGCRAQLSSAGRFG